MKTLVAYFSASGVTAEVAQNIANAAKADCFEITPKIPYSKEDLDWTNKTSRSSVEMQDLSSRPEIAKKVENIEDYSRVIIGFPVWWYTAPTIINTFVEQNDLSGKEIFVFVTSGGSGAEKSFNDLKQTYKDLNFVSSKRFVGIESAQEIKQWLD